jgi:hypothetical protein
MTSTTFTPLLPFVQHPFQPLSEGRSRDIFQKLTATKFPPLTEPECSLRCSQQLDEQLKWTQILSVNFTFTFVTVLHSRFIRHTLISWHSFHVACQYLIHMKGWNVLILLAMLLSQRDIMNYKALLSFCVTKVYHPLPHKTWRSSNCLAIL